jgi:hypothetical protein
MIFRAKFKLGQKVHLIDYDIAEGTFCVHEATVENIRLGHKGVLYYVEYMDIGTLEKGCHLFKSTRKAERALRKVRKINGLL